MKKLLILAILSFNLVGCQTYAGSPKSFKYKITIGLDTDYTHYFSNHYDLKNEKDVTIMKFRDSIGIVHIVPWDNIKDIVIQDGGNE